MPAKSTADVKLRYWLEKSDLAGELTLVHENGSVMAKSAKPFNLESLKNSEPKVIMPGEW